MTDFFCLFVCVVFFLCVKKMSEAEGKGKESAAAETPKAKPKLLQARTWVPLQKDYTQVKKNVIQFKEAAEHPLSATTFVPALSFIVL